jgi:CheY-like chemotaxis protein
LARLHGGDVSFISQVQGGSKFTILLPSDQGELLPNQLVLVAATDTMEILHFSGWLESLGYRIVIARSGMEALEKIRLLQPLASFLQPNLPVMGGEEVLTVLKHDRPQLANTVKLWTEAMNWDSLVNFFTALAQPPVPQRKPLLLYRSHFLRESIRESLQSLGYSLLECADLAQAEVLARLWRPDLVITSIPWSRYLHSIPTLIVEENLNRELLDRRIQERLNCQHPV